ncbi:HGGxSTG domain-containing protein [Sphingobium sp. AS12]|uniref:HGGxSTG domain-containing protein n=1 Tax=Sphingobium sp. AS12 TaxID=2849495 RepID=UPI0034A2C28A
MDTTCTTPSAARLCLAKTRKGAACRSRALKGKARCRLHGGRSPGAPMGNQRALKHGGYTVGTIKENERLRGELGRFRDHLKSLVEG